MKDEVAATEAGGTSPVAGLLNVPARVTVEYTVTP